MAARRRAVSADLQHRRAEAAAGAGERRHGCIAALPEGTPYGLVGTASLYKRESFPRGGVPEGSVTARWIGDKNDTSYRNRLQRLELFKASDEGTLNWLNQGAEAGLYDNEEIHAIRILAMEPTTDRRRGPKSGGCFTTSPKSGYGSWARFRCGSSTPTAISRSIPTAIPTPASSPRFPADTPFTFQLLNKEGMVLTMAQTWHQLGRAKSARIAAAATPIRKRRPSSKKPPPAGRATNVRPHPLHAAAHDRNRPTNRIANGTPRANRLALRAVGEERRILSRHPRRFFRRVAPLATRPSGSSRWACSCSTTISPTELPDIGKAPGTYVRLAGDHSYKAKFGYKPIWHETRWCFPNASRYVRMFQSRRSLLVWKILGRRTDGWTNDDHPTETMPGDPSTLQWHGKPLAPTQRKHRSQPTSTTPASACRRRRPIAGTFAAPDGTKIKVRRSDG